MISFSFFALNFNSKLPIFILSFRVRYSVFRKLLGNRSEENKIKKSSFIYLFILLLLFFFFKRFRKHDTLEIILRNKFRERECQT